MQPKWLLDLQVRRRNPGSATMYTTDQYSVDISIDRCEQKHFMESFKLASACYSEEQHGLVCWRMFSMYLSKTLSKENSTEYSTSKGSIVPFIMNTDQFSHSAVYFLELNNFVWDKGRFSQAIPSSATNPWCILTLHPQQDRWGNRARAQRSPNSCRAVFWRAINDTLQGKDLRR